MNELLNQLEANGWLVTASVSASDPGFRTLAEFHDVRFLKPNTLYVVECKKSSLNSSGHRITTDCFAFIANGRDVEAELRERIFLL